MLQDQTGPARSAVPIALLLALLGAGRARAAGDPMLASGFASNSVQLGGETGSVNLLNGGLTIPVPIGPTYRVSESLSYGLTLGLQLEPARLGREHRPGQHAEGAGREPVRLRLDPPLRPGESPRVFWRPHCLKDGGMGRPSRYSPERGHAL